MKTGTSQHPKFMMLTQLTGLSRPLLAGLLELTWHFAYEYSPGGDIGKWDDSLIESSIGWEGNPGEWIQALVSSGWLCRSEKHRIFIHDWAEHVPDFIKKRHKRRDLTVEECPCRSIGHRAVDDIQTTVTEREPTEPNPTEPNPTKCLADTESGDWILPMLTLTSKSTEAERVVWFESVWAEIIATAEIDQAREGGDIHKHRQRYAIRKWNSYLKTRDPSKRQFFCEARAQESAAALAASKASEAADLAREPPADSDPMADLLPFRSPQTQDSAP